MTAAGMGADVLTATTIDEFESALRTAQESSRVTVAQVHADPLVGAPDSEGWWDVPVAETSRLQSTQTACANCGRHKRDQRLYLNTTVKVSIQ